MSIRKDRDLEHRNRIYGSSDDMNIALLFVYLFTFYRILVLVHLATFCLWKQNVHVYFTHIKQSVLYILL